jgi:hypothetical protein
VLVHRGTRGEWEGAGDKVRGQGAAALLLSSGITALVAGCQQGARRNASANSKFEFLNEIWWVVWGWSPGSKHVAFAKSGTGLVPI